MQKNPVISIVMPVRNEGARVAETILSFVNSRSHAFLLEFVVVDDASCDGCCENLEDLINGPEQNVIIKKIRLDQWSGIPFARNLGANSASAPILVITDANVSATYGWDIFIFNNLKPGRALCATIADKVSDWKGYGCFLNVATMGIKWLTTPGLFNGYVPVMPCAGTVIYKDLFDRLGGYDTAMPVYGAAEPEFSLRLWLYGAVIVNVPDLVFYHRFRPVEERKPFLEQIKLTGIKNYLRFGLLYLDQDQTTAMLDHWNWVNPLNFNTAYNELDWPEINARKNYLKANLKNSFDWFLNRFQIELKAN